MSLLPSMAKPPEVAFPVTVVVSGLRVLSRSGIGETPNRATDGCFGAAPATLVVCPVAGLASDDAAT